MASVIHWFRRDLRIADNFSLFHASQAGLPVVPVYFASSWQGNHSWTGANRQYFLCGCLASLSRNLETLGGRLLIRHGDAVEGLRRLVIECGAVAIHFNKDPDPYGKIVEERLRKMCVEQGLDCQGHDDISLHRPDEVLTQGHQPYRVYTPYSRNWLALAKPKPVGTPKLLRTPAVLKSMPLPTVARWGLQEPTAQILEPGERAARHRLKAAVNGKIQTYATHRDFPAADGTSRISQDLRLGLISIRTVFLEAMKARAIANPAGRAGIDIFIKELAWREFYFAILHHFPNVLNEEFNTDWRGLPWAEPGALFERWKDGHTGFPLVDAGMRELLATGHMHNRVRMITAMFLTKDLHVDWKQGESHFMRHLLDGEIASNNGGWQWSAGTGADAAPYFRIQNPWSQSVRYDAKGAYIKHWIPELANVDAAKFSAPPADGKPLAPGYPLPCVDHAKERARTLEIFKRHRANGPRKA
jgi:deoxyribodipyrimidine photo-lyase